MNPWELASILSKALIYLGMLAIPGGMLVLWLSGQWGFSAPRSDYRQLATQVISRLYLLPAALIGLLATCLYFLVQIGSVNQRGVAGMFDPLMGSILVDTEVGVALRWHLAGFLLALLALMPLHLPGYPFQHRVARRFSWLMALAATSCFVLAVAAQGHASAVGALAQVLAAIHLLAVACWAGALYPLYILVVHPADVPEDADNQPDMAQVLHRFGCYGWTILAVMLLTGISLIWLLKGGLLTLFDNLHGQLLSVKILLVAGMMALGALHKFRWVPHWRAQAAQGSDTGAVRRALSRSIRLETLLALIVLLLTASLTTVTGPSG